MPLKFDSITADVFRLERTEKGLQLSVDDWNGAVLLPSGKLNMLAEFLTEAGRIMEDPLPKVEPEVEPEAEEPAPPSERKKPGRKPAAKKNEPIVPLPAARPLARQPEPKPETEEDEFVSTRVTALFQIQCRCGEQYLQKKNETVNWAVCTNCQSKVYTDRSKPLVETEKGPAWIMTNRYFVNKDMQVPQENKEWETPKGSFTIGELVGKEGVVVQDDENS